MDGSLEDMMMTIKSKPVGWYSRLKIVLHATCALEWMHGKNMWHRDVKSANILLKSDQGYLTDAGVAIYEDEASTFPPCGSPDFICPEYSATGKCNQFCDVFSLAVVLIQVFIDPELKKRKAMNGNGSVTSATFYHNVLAFCDSGEEDEINITKAHRLLIETPGCQWPVLLPMKLLKLIYRGTMPTQQGRPTMKEMLESLRELYFTFK